MNIRPILAVPSAQLGADSSRGQIYGVKEVTWGVTPATALKETRFTGESLKHAIGNTQSREVRSHREVTDLIQISFEAQGGFEIEFSFASFDDYLEAAMLSTWGAAITYTASTISAAAADNSINDSANAFPVIPVGQWIRIVGFTGGGPNGYARVVSRTVSKIVLAGITVAIDAAGEAVTISGQMLRNGTTKVSMTMEKVFTDIAQYIAYTGMMVNDWAQEINANELITGSFGFMGKSGSAPSGASVGTGGPVAANSNDVMSAVANVAQLMENDSVLSGTYARNLTWSLSNNLRGKPGIGVMGNTDVGIGTLVLTGRLNTYFENGTLYNKFRNGTSSSIMTRLTDAFGNSYIISFPRIELTDGNPNIPGQSQDVMLDMAWQATRHPTYLCTVQIDKFVGP